MGVVKKQAFQNTVIQYIGVALGYLNTVVLFPMILDIDEYGLTRVFFAIAGIYVNLSSLGAVKIIVRFFPFFDNHYRNSNGIFLLAGGFCLIGFAIITAIFLLLKEPILAQYSEGSALFADNFNLTIPIAFSMLIFALFESYLIAIKKTVLSHFLRNIFIRIIWAIEVLLYYINWIDFAQFLLLFIYSYYILVVILYFKVMLEKQIVFPIRSIVIPFRLLKIIVNYGLFTIVSGISLVLTNRIDVIMITFMLSLADNAVYSIAMYISSVILIPMQNISRISFPVVARDWKAKRMKNIEKLYKQSSITQLVTGGFIFLCIWINIDDIFAFFDPEYINGKYVVLFLGLAALYDMITGINNVIMVVTKYYKVESYASFGLAILTIITNYLLIPVYGIKGAALATAISIVLYNTSKYVIINYYLRMHPFSINTVKVIAILLGVYLLLSAIPALENNHILSILLKSVILAIVYIPVIYITKVLPEMNDEVLKFINKYMKK